MGKSNSSMEVRFVKDCRIGRQDLEDKRVVRCSEQRIREICARFLRGFFHRIFLFLTLVSSNSKLSFVFVLCCFAVWRQEQKEERRERRKRSSSYFSPSSYESSFYWYIVIIEIICWFLCSRFFLFQFLLKHLISLSLTFWSFVFSKSFLSTFEIRKKNTHTHSSYL